MKKSINEVIKEYKEYSELLEETKKQLEVLKAQAVDYLNENEIDEVLTDEGKITYREVISKRFDSTSFKKDFADIYAEYQRPSSSMRFTCN